MRFKSILISIGLVIGVLTTPFSITTAAALEIKIAPANWGYIYASGKTASVQTIERNFSAYIEKKSNFIVNFNTVPAIARVAVQEAVDTWAANFASSVPVNVNVNSVSYTHLRAHET